MSAPNDTHPALAVRNCPECEGEYALPLDGDPTRRCPHCDAPARTYTRNREHLTPTYRAVLGRLGFMVVANEKPQTADALRERLGAPLRDRVRDYGPLGTGYFHSGHDASRAADFLTALHVVG